MKAYDFSDGEISASYIHLMRQNRSSAQTGVEGERHHIKQIMFSKMGGVI